MKATPSPKTVALLAAAATSSLLLTPAGSQQALAQSTGNRALGLDVSAWQGTVNWTQVANSGKSFAFIRSSRGGTTGTYNQNTATGTLSQRYDDPYFVSNITGATSAGMFAGPYHFARPDIVTNWPVQGQIPNDGVDEANHFLQQAGVWMKPGYLLPVLDIEAGQAVKDGTPGRSAAALSQFYIDFSNRIKAVVGVAPIAYVNQSYANYLQASVATNMPINWVARYNGQGSDGYSYLNINPHYDNPEPSPSTANVYGKWNPSFPTIPAPEQPWKFWQYTSQGRVPGIGGGTANVDLNVAHGGIEFLKDYLVPALWTPSASGDWSAIANWNSDNPGYVSTNPATGPAPRLPAANDTVILDNALATGTYTVTLSTGTHTIRKLYAKQPLNLTGGSLTINYVPVAESTPNSAQFSSNVSLSGSASLSVHTLLVDAARTFTLSGGTLTLNKMTLGAGATPAKLLVNGNVSFTPLDNANTLITSSSTTNSATLDLGGGTRTLTVGDGSAAVDLTLDLPIVSGSITKAGPGTLQLNRAATLNSTVTVNAGALISTLNSQLGTGVSLASAGSLHLAGNLSYNLPLTIGGAGSRGASGTAPGNPGALHALSGSPTWSGAITLAGTGANGSDPLINQVSAASGSTLTLSGVISSASSGAFAKSDNGDVVLAGSSPNTYPGISRVYGGRLILEKDAALGSAANHTYQLSGSASTIAFRSASSLNYATQEYLHTDGTGAPGFAQVDNLAGNNTFAGSIAFGGPTLSGAITSSVGVTAGSLTLSGGLYSRTGFANDTRTLNKTGTGTLVLTGDSSLAPAASSAAAAITSSTLNITAGAVDLRAPSPASANVPGLSAYAVSPGATLLNTTGTLTGVSVQLSGSGATFQQGASARLHNASLTIADNATAQFSPSTLAPSLLTSLTLSPLAKLDLTTNGLVVDYTGSSPADTIRQKLLSGRNNGSWTGFGLITSAANAANDPQLRTAIGYAESSLFSPAAASQLAGGLPVDSTAVLLKYTWYGDANLDGQIDRDDFALLDRGFAKGLTGWVNGDFNYDGVVNAADYLLIDRVFTLQGNPLSPEFLAQRESQFGSNYVAELLVSIPEPSSAACLLMAALPLLSRRRRTS